MSDTLNAETLGAWVVHHGRKLQSDQNGPAEFSAIDGAAKSGLLLVGMASSENIDLSASEVAALAKMANLNPKTELKTYLEMLRQRQLIDISPSGSGGAIVTGTPNAETRKATPCRRIQHESRRRG